MISCPVAAVSLFSCVGSTAIPQQLIDDTGRRQLDKPAFTGQLRTVSTEAQFLTALANSQPNDQVNIAPGNYSWQDVTIANVQPGVCIDASAATFSDTKIFVNSPVTLWGANFLNNNQTRDIEVRASDAKILSGTHIGSGQGQQFALIIYVDQDANNVEVADNLIDRPARDSFGIAIGTNTDYAPQNAYVHHNTLQDSASYDGTQGGAAIRIGLSGNTSGSLVELNRIHNWNDDPETIEIKASDNTIINNLITLSGAGHISNRIGNNNVYYGNYVEEAIHAIRISGDNNTFVYNYAGSSGSALAIRLFNETTGEAAGNNNTISCNIMKDYLFWMGINEQGGNYVSSPIGNIIDSNIYLGSPDPVETTTGYFDNTGNSSFSNFIADNTVSGNDVLTASGTQFCGEQQQLKESTSINGQTYVIPDWMRGMFVGV